MRNQNINGNQEARTRIAKTQERYKRNCGVRLSRQREVIKKDDNVYLRVERRDESQTRHKLAAIAEGRFKVLSTKGNTVVIERLGKTLERVAETAYC